MSKNAELVRHLRAYATPTYNGLTVNITDRAADAIEALEAENAALKAYIENDADWKFSAKRRLELFREMRAKRDALEAENARLREALGPVLRLLEWYHLDALDGPTPELLVGRANEYILRARAALEGK